MSHIKHLLAATDLSAPARHAAERAALLAQALGARLDLTHVVNKPLIEKLQHYMAGTTPSTFNMVEQAREELHHLAAALVERFHLSPTVHIEYGPLLQTLSQQVDAVSPDLFVLGSHGAGVMHQLVLGSTAERMLRKVSCPTLVVKHAPEGSYRRVLVPVDFSPASLPAIRLAHAIAPKAELLLLHAYSVPFEGKLRLAGVDEYTITHYREMAKQEATHKLYELGRQATLPERSVASLVVYGDAWMQILEQEQEQDCDLIVIGKHGESMLEDLLLGSVTKVVLAQSQGDVLVSL